MPVAVFSRFTALLALVALAGGLAGLIFPRRVAAVTGVRGALGLAAAVAAVAMTGSLVYSEYFLFEPCRLCWYQRIAMYPLVVVLFVAWRRRDRRVGGYAAPLAVVGGLISLVHLGNQWILTGTSCGAGPSCAVRYVTEFGFVTIPFMALSGFVAILGMLRVVRRA